VIGVILGALVLAACSRSQPSGPQGVAFEGGGVRFAAPLGWQVAPSGSASSGAGHWLVYLGTQALHDRCGGDSPGSCRPPVDQLVAGGVLIAWHTRNCAGPDCTLPHGEATRVGGREAIMLASQNSCGQIGETEETDYLVAVSPQRIDTIVVCARAVTEATRRTIRSFLDQVMWRTP
jgi:hypothetical protein